jgi:predicted lysophospholipase L1 biosynthesis ABC-type transport system permease subunit
MAVGQPIASAAPAEIAQQVNLSWGKAVEISINSVRIRFGRSLITASGIILAIAFLMSIWTTNAIIAELKAANDPSINLQLQRKGIDVDSDSEAAAQERSKNTWLVVLSLLVCLVGITNAMLMSVTERFREIGTMKCLGALDSFIIKLFLLESAFQGSAGTLIGVVLGFLLTLLLNVISYGGVVFSHLPGLELLKNALLAVAVGSFLSLTGGILPAYKAAKMEPVDAMRLEV